MSTTGPARVRTLGVSLSVAPTGRKPTWRMQTYTHTKTAPISKRILAKLIKIKERHPYMSLTGPARVRTLGVSLPGAPTGRKPSWRMQTYTHTADSNTHLRANETRHE